MRRTSTGWAGRTGTLASSSGRGSPAVRTTPRGRLSRRRSRFRPGGGLGRIGRKTTTRSLLPGPLKAPSVRVSTSNLLCGAPSQPGGGAWRRLTNTTAIAMVVATRDDERRQGEIAQRQADLVGQHAGVDAPKRAADDGPPQEASVGDVRQAHRRVHHEAHAWQVAATDDEDRCARVHHFEGLADAPVGPGPRELGFDPARVLASQPEECGVADDRT